MKRILLIGAALLLLLSGCSGAAEASSEGGGHGASSEEEVVGYPVGWPKADVPMLDSTLLHFAHPGNLWAGWVEAHDLVADLASAKALLVDAGYEITLDADGYFEFSNADRIGRVVAAEDATWGPCLLYTFTDGVQEAADAEQQDQEQQDHDSGGGDH